MARSRILTEEHSGNIMNWGKLIGDVQTPMGVIEIIETVESHGYKTNYLPKAFRYIKIPSGEMARLTQRTQEYWKKQGWQVTWY